MVQQYKAAVTHAVLSWSWYHIICNSGFNDDIDNGTIGVCIKDVYVPQSNSVFEFVAEVVCETYPQSFGCIVKEK